MVLISSAAKPRIFISYSRDDLDFADQLAAALQPQNFDIAIDREGISGGEDWKQRLGTLILEADTVVFVLSPSSARSSTCQWEVTEAVRLGKRILPVLCRSLDDATPPEPLTALNYIFFYAEPRVPGSGFGSGIARLVTALNTDLEWLREHTRLRQRAVEWESGGRATNRLLSGMDIAAARDWATRRPASAPPVSDLVLDFIQTSERAEAAQKSDREREAEEKRRLAEEALAQSQRVVRRTRAFLGIAAVLAAVAFGGAFYAEQQRQEARVQAERALSAGVEAAKQATAARIEAQRAERSETATRQVTKDAQITQSGLLANTASRLHDAELGRDPGTAALLALEALPDASSSIDRPLVPAARAGLASALLNLREVQVFADIDEATTSAQWRPDGKRILVARGNIARISDPSTGTTLVELRGHEKKVSHASWSTDGTLVATTSDDMTARIWDAATGELKHLLKDVGGEPIWSRDGSRLLFREKKVLEIIDLRSGKILKPFQGHCLKDIDPLLKCHVRAAIWAPDNEHVMSAADDGIRLWSTSTGEQNGQNDLRTPYVDLVWAQRGPMALFGLSNGDFAIIHLGRGETIKRFSGHCPPGPNYGGFCHVYKVAWSRDHAYVATVAFDRKIFVWEIDTGAVVTTIDRGESVKDLSWSPDGKYLALVSGSTLRVYDAKTGAAAFSFEGSCSQKRRDSDSVACDMTSLEWSSDSNLILTASDDGTARIWTVALPKSHLSLDGQSRFWNMALSPSTKLLAGGSFLGNTARVYEVATGREVANFNGHVGTVYNAAWSPDETQIATASDDGTARIWELGAKQEKFVLRGHEGPVEAIGWSGDGTTIATGARDSTAIIWEANTGKERARLKGHKDRIWNVSFSPDSKYLATASNDQTAIIWDLATAHPVHVLSGHVGAVICLSWSADGAHLATGGEDKTVRIWDVTSGQQQLEFKGPKHFLRSFAWDKEGQTILVSDDNGVVGLYNAASGREIDSNVVSEFGGSTFSSWLPVVGKNRGPNVVVANSMGGVRFWQPYASTQVLVDTAKARMQRCLTPAQRAAFYLPPAPPTWCVERRLWPYQSDAWQSWLSLHKAWLANGREGLEPALPTGD